VKSDGHSVPKSTVKTALRMAMRRALVDTIEGAVDLL
jgi:hypothetical protein